MKKTAIILILLISSLAVHAQDNLQRALDRYDYGTAVHLIDSLMAVENADSISLALQKARCLRKLYRADEAAEAVAGVLHIDQFNIELLAELAECQVQAGNPQDAFGLYSMLTGMQPDNLYFKICKARILYREKQYRESIDVCMEIIARDSIPDIIAMTADAYKHLGQADSALVYYDHVLHAKPWHAATVSKKADILLAEKQYIPVIEMTREFLDHDPDNMTVLPIHGLALHLHGEYLLSIDAFERQRELGDDSYGIHYYIGMNNYMLNVWPHAVDELEKAYQIDSSDVNLVFQLAHAKSNLPYAKSGQGLNPESERLYAKALDMLKADPGMMHNIYGSMAMARHRIEEYDKAIKYYELSFKYNPKNISALSSIGYCYERMKNYKKALEYYEMYMKRGKPGTSGYKFVEESIAYVKQELVMEE